MSTICQWKNISTCTALNWYYIIRTTSRKIVYGLDLKFFRAVFKRDKLIAQVLASSCSETTKLCSWNWNFPMERQEISIRRRYLTASYAALVRRRAYYDGQLWHNRAVGIQLDSRNFENRQSWNLTSRGFKIQKIKWIIYEKRTPKNFPKHDKLNACFLDGPLRWWGRWQHVRMAGSASSVMGYFRRGRLLLFLHSIRLSSTEKNKRKKIISRWSVYHPKTHGRRTVTRQTQGPLQRAIVA